MKRSSLFITLLFLVTAVAVGQVPFPCWKVGQGSVNSSVTIRSPGCIEAPKFGSVQITGDNRVEFIAGHEIALLDGFSVDGLTTQGEFGAFIERADFEVVVFEPENFDGFVQEYEKFELGLKLPQDILDDIDDFLNDLGGNNPLNPYNPNDISVVATFTSPTNQSKTALGFYYVDHERDVPNNNWIIQPTDYPFRIRAALDELGPWDLSIAVNVKNLGTLEVNNLKVTCTASDNPGFLFVDPFNKRYLRFSKNGDPFFAIGQNIAWAEHKPVNDHNPYLIRFPTGLYKVAGSNGFKTHDGYVRDLADKGGNYFRYIIASFGGGAIEMQKLGVYNQTYSWELDHLLDLAHDEDLYMHLNMELHGHFQPSNENWMSNKWENNPYNTELGLSSPKLFFSDPLAKEYYKQRLRYMISRWGYSTNLAVWELFSEVDGIESYSSSPAFRAIVASWHIEMATHIKTLLDKKHMISTSYSGDPQLPDFSFASPDIDITSMHRYDHRRNDNVEHRFNMTEVKLDTYDKPFIFGEMGSADGIDDEIDDGPEIDKCDVTSFHNRLWATAFMGGYGAGLQWWVWQDDSYRDQFIPLSAFLDDIDFNAHSFKPQRFPEDPFWDDDSDPFLEAFTLVSADKKRAMGWAHNRTNYWGNLRGTNSCLDNLVINNIVDLPDDDDPTYSFPINVTSTIIIKGLQFPFVTYEVDWYSTSIPNFPFLHYPAVTTTATGKLFIDTPNFVESDHDYAYKIYRPGHSFKTSNNNNSQAVKEAYNQMSPLESRASQLAAIEVFPNPAGNQCWLVSEGIETSYRLMLYNALGEMVMEENNLSGNRHRIDLQKLPSGAYFMRMEFEDQVFNLKLFKK